MINESVTLLTALVQSNIVLPSYHPRIKVPGSSFGETIRVALNNDGAVSSVDKLTDEEKESLWTIKEGNQNSFPVIRLTVPIRRIKKKDRNLLCRLRDEKTKELLSLQWNNDNDNNTIHSFAMAFQYATKDIDALCDSIHKKVEEMAANGRLNRKLANSIMSDVKGSSIQFAFDLANNSIYNSNTRNALETILPTEYHANQVANNKKCALTGKRDILCAPFPKVRFPVLNKDLPIFSMFHEAKCNSRYDLIDYEIIPISRSEAMNIAKALLWATDACRQGKTWRGITRGEKQDLLIVYVDGKPDIPAEVGNIFGTDQDSIEKQFEADAGTVCQALDGIAKQKPQSKLNLFVIRDVSIGQAQIVLSESFKVERISNAAKQWENAIKNNLPSVGLLLPSSKKHEDPFFASPPVPYPDEIVKILSRKYINQGADNRNVKSISFGEVLDFMVRKEGKWIDAAERMMTLLLQNYEPLLIGLFGAKISCDKEKNNKYSALARKDALRAISLFGLLLDANNRKKEIYMNDAAFKVGGFLALADILHRDYCVVVRKDSLPTYLMGNAMMARALDNPKEAIADLAERMRIYIGWAETVDDNEQDTEQKKIKVLQARKTLRRYALLAQQLHALGLPDHCDETMKAEILLGYLASTKGIDNENNETEQEASK